MARTRRRVTLIRHSETFETIYDRRDRLMGQTQSGPAGGGTPVSPGLTAGLERLMTDRIKTPFADVHATCRLFLELSADDLAKAKRTRDYYAKIARRHGLTNAAIGAALGVSEARVRQIIADAD